MPVLRVFRLDPEREHQPHWQDYPLTGFRGTVLEALRLIQEQHDPTLAFPEAPCGDPAEASAMLINGVVRLAATTTVASLESYLLTIEPLPHLMVVRDLLVDRRPLFRHWEEMLRRAEQPDSLPPRERLQSAAERTRLEPWLHLRLSGALWAVDPLTASHRRYLGPEALCESQRLSQDSRYSPPAQFWDHLDGDFGAFRARLHGLSPQAHPTSPETQEAARRLRHQIIARRLRRLLTPWRRG